LEAFEYLLQKPDATSALQRDALQRLIRLYEGWDKTAPDTGKDVAAGKWGQKLEAFDRQRPEEKIAISR